VGKKQEVHLTDLLYKQTKRLDVSNLTREAGVLCLEDRPSAMQATGYKVY
jgi:hypothetical protein